MTFYEILMSGKWKMFGIVLMAIIQVAKSAGAAEYTDYISEEG